MNTAAPNSADKLETALSRIFALCDANRAALLKAREDAKLFATRYWWQDEQETQTTHKAR